MSDIKLLSVLRANNGCVYLCFILLIVLFASYLILNQKISQRKLRLSIRMTGKSSKIIFEEIVVDKDFSFLFEEKKNRPLEIILYKRTQRRLDLIEELISEICYENDKKPEIYYIENNLDSINNLRLKLNDQLKNFVPKNSVQAKIKDAVIFAITVSFNCSREKIQQNIVKMFFLSLKLKYIDAF